MVRSLATVLFLTLGLAAPGLLGQTAVSAAPATAGNPVAGPSAGGVAGSVVGTSTGVYQSTSYQLGEGDLIDIRVYGVQEFTQTIRLDATGIIDMPLIGPIVASGKTVTELETELAKQLDGHLVRNPQVSVLITEYRSQSVLVLGAVQTPGEFNLTQEATLVGVIAMAGGLTDLAQDEIIIQRDAIPEPGEPPATEKQRITVNVRDLLEKGMLSLDRPVYAGDVIRVPERVQQQFYVVGEVLSPGAYLIPWGEELRMTHALARTGGPSKTARANKGKLIRHLPDGKRQQIDIDYMAILKGRKPDLLVQPDDVIFIPGSKIKNITQAMLGVAPNTVSDLPRVVLRN